MFCTKCGKELKNSWKVCPNCGSPANNQYTGHQISKPKKISKALHTKWEFWAIIFMILGLGVIISKFCHSVSEDSSLDPQNIEVADSTDQETEDEVEDFTDQVEEDRTENPIDQAEEDMVTDFADQETEDEAAETFDDSAEYISDEGSDFPVWSKEYLFWYTQGLHDEYIDSYIKIAKNILERTDQLNANIYLKTEGGLFEDKHFEMTKDDSVYLYAGEVKDNKPTGLGILLIKYQYLEQEKYNEYGEYETAPLYLPIYIGEFSEGRYNGTGISYVDRSESVSITDVRVENVEDIDLLEYSEQYFLSIDYIGNFSNGEKSGDGVSFLYPSPSLSEYGSWADIENMDMYDLSNITITLGQFKDDKLNGEGKIYEDQQLLYEGGFEDDDFCGMGIQYFPNSTKIQYKGEFKRGEYNGTGTLYDEDGNIIYEGKWNFGDYTD